MSDFELKVTGLREVQRSLYSYSQQLGDKVVIDAEKVAMRPMQKAAKSKAPRLTGRLQRGIVVRKSKINNGRRKQTVGVYMTLRKGKGKRDPKDAFYGRWQESGWTDRSGKKQPGKFFMRYAFNTQKQNSVNVFVAAVQRGAEILKRKVGLR